MTKTTTITTTEPSDSVDAGAQLATEAGRQIHLAVARLLDQGIRQPTAFEVITIARDTLSGSAASSTRRQSAIQRLSTATACYFRLFVPDTSWVYVGSEMAAHRCRYDFVFESTDGEVIADELKAGRVATRVELKLADEQIARQVAAGTARWGDHFVGVRALFLAAPRASYLARPDGSRDLIFGDAQ